MNKSQTNRLDKIVEAAGCTYEDDGCYITIDAPDGKVFEVNGLHYFSVEYDAMMRNASEQRAAFTDALKLIKEDLDWNLRFCDIDDCEICPTEVAA